MLKPASTRHCLFLKHIQSKYSKSWAEQIFYRSALLDTTQLSLVPSSGAKHDKRDNADGREFLIRDLPEIRLKQNVENVQALQLPVSTALLLVQLSQRLFGHWNEPLPWLQLMWKGLFRAHAEHDFGPGYLHIKIAIAKHEPTLSLSRN